MSKVCICCGVLFEEKTTWQKYCCIECKYKANNKLRPKTEHKCVYCGALFVGNGKSKYCSKKCSHRFSRQKQTGKPIGLMSGGRIPDEGSIVQRVRCKTSRFEYIGGWTNLDNYIYLECKDCGLIFKHSSQFLRPSCTKATICPYCSNLTKKEYVPIEPTEKKCSGCGKLFLGRSNKKYCSDNCSKKSWKIENGYVAPKRIKPKQIRYLICECCHDLFIPDGRQKKYCSDKCARKIENRRATMKKRIHGDKREIGKIDLKVLYERDKGVCALCGFACDWNDCKMINGVFYTGPTYPSRDHIKPLAKGGEDTWENIQLAHFKCNWKKGDKWNDTARKRRIEEEVC